MLKNPMSFCHPIRVNPNHVSNDSLAHALFRASQQLYRTWPCIHFDRVTGLSVYFCDSKNNNLSLVSALRESVKNASNVKGNFVSKSDHLLRLSKSSWHAKWKNQWRTDKCFYAVRRKPRRSSGQATFPSHGNITRFLVSWEKWCSSMASSLSRLGFHFSDRCGNARKEWLVLPVGD